MPLPPTSVATTFIEGQIPPDLTARSTALAWSRLRCTQTQVSKVGRRTITWLRRSTVLARRVDIPMCRKRSCHLRSIRRKKNPSYGEAWVFGSGFWRSRVCLLASALRLHEFDQSACGHRSAFAHFLRERPSMLCGSRPARLWRSVVRWIVLQGQANLCPKDSYLGNISQPLHE